MRCWPVFPLLLLLAVPSAALEPYLVKDINPLPESLDSSPRDFAAFKGAAFFSADDGVSGFELWRSDGTEAGTWLVEDLCEPDCSGNPVPYAVTPDLYFFLDGGTGFIWVTGGDAASTFRLPTRARSAALWVPSQRVLYFAGGEAAHGDELWRSDGTPAGTHMVADIWPGPQGSRVHSLAELGGKVYFSANDGRGGGLWRSDGTARGTVLVKAVESEGLRTLGNRLIFRGFTPARGIELWRSDGTAKGTVMLADIAPGKASSEIALFASIGKRLFLFARVGTGLQHLWVTDGTAAGTRPLSQPAGLKPGGPGFAAALGSRLLFAASHSKSGDELWTTDGTAKGTLLLRELCPGICSGIQGGLFTANQGRLFFNGLSPGHGEEPWVTDGTAAGTRMVRDVCPGSCSSSPKNANAVGRRVLFLANFEVAGHELWSTDGTAAGTSRIAEFSAKQHIVNYYVGAVAGGRLLFAGLDASHGLELWRSDGTAAGTSLVRDINRADVGGASINLIGAVGDRAFFYARDGERGHELWKSDGTEAGTELVHERIPGEEPLELAVYNELADAAGSRLFFFRRIGGELTLWATDGTAAGTLQLHGPDLLPCCQLRGVGSQAFFFARQNGEGALWASDGTAAGTRRVKGSFPVQPGNELRAFTAFQGKLYFLAPGEQRDELWRSDGTAAGTLPFAQGLTDVSNLAVHAGRLWFVADDGEHGRELWSTDGTPAGTRLELDTVPGPDSLSMGSMIFVEDRLFFTVPTLEAGDDGGLWVSDLTEAGTLRVSRVQVQRFGTGFQGSVYFSVSDLFSSVAWRSDGTEAGTGPLLGQDGEEIEGPFDTAVLGDRLLFTGGQFPIALWETDGTQAGTVRLRNVSTNGTSGAWLLTEAGSRVFFGSNDPGSGHELWAVENE